VCSSDLAGTIGVALQYQGPEADLPPLVFTINKGDLKLLPARKPIQHAMKNYCGSIVMDRSGKLMAVSSPHGNIVTFWQSDTGELVHTLKLQDGCGLAPTDKPFTFLLSAGTGERLIYNVKTKAATKLSLSSSVHWDNHIMTGHDL